MGSSVISHSSLQIALNVVHNANNPLAARIEMDVPHFHRLAIAAAVAIEGADQINL
jgi:hypothetical protein